MWFNCTHACRQHTHTRRSHSAEQIRSWHIASLCSLLNWAVPERNVSTDRQRQQTKRTSTWFVIEVRDVHSSIPRDLARGGRSLITLKTEMERESRESSSVAAWVPGVCCSLSVKMNPTFPLLKWCVYAVRRRKLFAEDGRPRGADSGHKGPVHDTICFVFCTQENPPGKAGGKEQK